MREARDTLPDIVNEAAVRGTVTYLTNRGRRVAAIVPVVIAEQAEDRPPAGSLMSADELDVEQLKRIARAAQEYVMAGLCGNQPSDQRDKLVALVEAARTDR